MLVAIIAKPTVSAVLEEIERARSYADLFEIRLDALEKLEGLGRFSVPVLFTFRRGKVAEEARLRWIEQLLALEPEYCDLETDTDPLWIEHLAQKYPKTRFIGSYHNFEEMPGDLEQLWASMQNRHFVSYKIAATARSNVDWLRMMAFARGKRGSLSCISMGKVGLPARALGPVMGNFFDYASSEEESSRYSLKTLCEVYRYRRLNRDTGVYALLGDPVEQSPGPLFHNRAFGEQNGVYIKMEVGEGEIAEVLRWMRQLPFRGCSVTMPLKEAIIPFLDHLDGDAASIGAVNTIAVRKGVWVGSNTDGRGALRVLEKHLPVKGKRLAILGAGGTARAIAFEAMRRGASVALFNRTALRAEQVAAALGCKGHPLEAMVSHPCDLLVNTLPFPAEVPKLPIAAMDVSYVHSPFGKAMWLEQAALQQKIWQ